MLVSPYLGLVSWMYLHLRVDVHSETRTQYHLLQTPSKLIMFSTSYNCFKLF
ncbi:unnamed protein product [Schistosoma margrebowiei]|uniref:Uncharacterized protein n=1 Tax=Schistosoma margrebowiei TaxID=48269 RepID=A0A183N1Z6_9TREM|nr:unnamed protein product [Schistosoma margrebowiei]